MDGHPGEPRQRARPMGLEGPSHVGDGCMAADGGHVSLVEIVEQGSRLACHILGDHLRGVTAHLHGRLGYSGNLAAVFFDVGQIAADKDLRMTGRIQVKVDDGAARLSVGVPSILPRGEAWTPAAHKVTTASRRFPPTMT